MPKIAMPKVSISKEKGPNVFSKPLGAKSTKGFTKQPFKKGVEKMPKEKSSI
jgi:hypothetical protein